MSKPQYTVIIQWSPEDDAYVVSLPEWGESCKTHGSTYEEAARKAQEVLELLIKTHDPRKSGPLPDPKLFNYPGSDVVGLPGHPANRSRSAVA
ncbi:MAG TPA: type II toxin-antitoxin system HicB family antitoxin [Humisphaera sp.]|jgi:predicted RNase H-like HicB family nuclease|nr:type II toxin-antitoxin system HicB family antitoxin [Humisphaera sp.]